MEGRLYITRMCGGKIINVDISLGLLTPTPGVGVGLMPTISGHSDRC